MKYTFSESFGYGPTRTDYCASFSLILSREEVEILHTFFQEDGECDHGYLETASPVCLFALMMQQMKQC